MYEDSLFIITVDTEADDAWQPQERIGMRNLSAIPRFQALCEQYDITPTYLLAYECTVRDEALEVLKPIVDRGGCEIGLHLHCWTTPPFEREHPAGFDAAWMKAYQYELPDSLFLEKAECLLKSIESAYGVRPTSHRAGRWGIDQRTIDWLIENRFTIDTSVVPSWDLSTKIGKNMFGPSFLNAQRSPYRWLHREAGNELSRSVLEVPLTVFMPKAPPLTLMVNYLQRQWAGNKLVTRIYHRCIGGYGLLRPHPQQTVQTLFDIIQSQLTRGPTIIHMMIHSSELMAGQSPFSRTLHDCEVLWEKLRRAFAFIRGLGIKSTGISDSARILEENKVNHENSNFTSRFQRSWWRSRLLPEARGQILDACHPSDYRNPAR